MRHFQSRFLGACGAMLLSAFLAVHANAAYTITFAPDGSGNVVAIGSGTLDTTDLTYTETYPSVIGVEPDRGPPIFIPGR